MFTSEECQQLLSSARDLVQELRGALTVYDDIGDAMIGYCQGERLGMDWDRDASEAFESLEELVRELAAVYE